ncbi:elongation factor G-like protein EF-G2 [Streptomyces tirandamycinicus]|uniref:Elongation factor G-like protein n=1 Tax=Streptomyces tirandamycinicus TaxID=2174846 RepID=A0A2S1SSJ3_9ACTN|nr:MULTISPECIES: elongation factor G-like protein EF-G2 [Streptomyces]AWI29371.1 elongation factor G-like protein EF-G2 [Streptomyces tirandamycinicus]MCY0979753.1 elongation factor G-like protein EF-G2 [Streptomyces tirandamycinicus]NNJ07672.1 elongation factor G-like protein EF-G2 [Streptomyces sp. PKU-MA01144]TFE38691.1 elongation factor G-like protein EF-G2 [Streptomyces sp. ICN441]
MGDKANAQSGAAGRATTADRPTSVRNVVLVGHSGSGKTTLVEALALTAGAVNRAGRVEDGGTVSDYDEIEHRQQRSVQLSLVPVEWGGYKINLLDTPGYADFVGELRAGLRAADAALFVVSAAQEADAVPASTRMVWEECAAVGMPRAIVVTHLETARTGFDELIEVCGRLFGGDDPDAVLPLYLPQYGPEAADGHAPVTGLVGLLSRKLYDYSAGERVEKAPGPEQEALLAGARNRLIEGIIAESEDETLMERYLGGEEVDLKTLIDDLEKAVARGVFHPVLAAAPAVNGARQGLGTVELLELITGGFPTPLEREAPAVTTPDGRPRPAVGCDPDGPLVAEVVRTASDPYVGRLSLVRVFSGTLRPDETVHVSGHGLADRGHEDHDVDERVGTLSSPFGKQQRTVGSCIAGDLACVAKLGRAETGDTISSTADPLLMEPWAMPDPLLPVAIRAHSKADEDRLSQGLARLVAEDPTMRLEQNQDTRQVVLWCLGEAHVDVALERLRSRYGVQVDVVPHKVSLRETFAGPSAGRGRHVKQSGGHGQYAICEIEVEPLPPGSGIEFVDKVVGGAVPRQFIPSVEKGVRAQAAKGLAAGHPLVDVRVTLLDGKAHSVDSSDAAFQTAGALALREAAAQARIDLLEPVAEVQVMVPDEYVGAVMSDLSGRRGRVVGTEQAGTGRTVVRAEVPEIEIGRYAVDLRSISHGTGRFDRTYARHEAMPPQMAAKVREETTAAA